MSRTRPLLCLLIVGLLVPVASAGTRLDPEIDDPAGDTQLSKGACNPAVSQLCDNVFTDTHSPAADITGVWVTEANDTYTFHVETAAPGDATTTITLSYSVAQSNISIHTGVAGHDIPAFTVTDTTPNSDAPANTTAVRNNDVLEITVTRADTQAVGGDVIQNITVSASDTEAKSSNGVSRTDTTTDTTEGASRPFNLTRPAIVPDLELVVVGGEFEEEGADNATAFTGNIVDLESRSATVRFKLQLTNTGTDPDDATLAIFDPTGTLAGANITATLQPGSVGTLLPGETANVTLTAVLDEADFGDHPILVSATSGRGAIAAAAMQVSAPAPPPPVTRTPTATQTQTNTGGQTQDSDREPVPAGLGFLTPMAEGLGLDGPFGKYAELVLLAILLLLVILIVFLLVFFLTRTPVAIHLEPNVVEARPGETAEFSVLVRNRRNRSVDAVTHFEGDPAWRTGLAFGAAEMTQQNTDARLGLGPKGADSGTRIGTLRVTVPPSAQDRETDLLTVAVSALNDAGRPIKTRSASVRVRAVGGPTSTGALPMRLASVEHSPSEPVAGQTVQTTARIENDSPDETLQLRVVLNVDGQDVQEQPLSLPPQSARAVVFRWEVPEGSSKVRVRVYPG